MLRKWTWLVCLMTGLVVDAGSQEVMRDSSFRRLLSKRYSVHTPRTQWSYHPQEDLHRQQPQGISHGHGSHPYESTLRATETASDYPVYSSPQEYWRFASANSNFTGAYHYAYPGGRPAATDGTSYQDTRMGSHSVYQYQQMRPAAASHVTVKKAPGYSLKGNHQLQSFDAPGKSKYKKTTLPQTTSAHNKNAYPRVHQPYAKHKYPTLKAVHPLYRNYHQSPYQRYAISPGEMLRYRFRAPGEGYYKASTASPSPASVTQRHHTTERMDYPEMPSALDDSSAYNDTHQSANGSYYETYEEVEKTILEPEESLYDENTTRGYYGDRIYMSTQVPLVTSPDKAAVKNKYFIVRRTSNDEEDIETIFE